MGGLLHLVQRGGDWAGSQQGTPALFHENSGRPERTAPNSKKKSRCTEVGEEYGENE